MLGRIQGESWHQQLLKIVDECSRHKDAARQIDFNAVKKQVIKSQPPRAADVPNLVDFVRVWGGLPSGSHMRELSELCTLIPSDRVVSGSFFKSLAKLKDEFPGKSLPTTFINSVLYVHAQADENVTDGFSRFITTGEVSSFASKDKRDAVFEADAILHRSRSMMNDAPSRVRLPLMSQLKIDVVMAVVARKSREDARSLTEIAKDFAHSAVLAVGGVPMKQETTTTTKTVQELATTNAVMYSADGTAEEVGRSTVLNKGFKVGMYVRKAKGLDKCEQWRITAIDIEGTVSVCCMNADGSSAATTSSIAIETFLEEYREVNEIELVDHYPAAYPIYHMADLKLAIAKGKAMEMIAMLLNKYQVPDVFIMKKPEKKVCARSAFKVGKFNLVPATYSVEIVADVPEGGKKKECPRRSVECTCPDLEVRVFLHPVAPAKEYTNPFWSCRVVPKIEDANMTFKNDKFEFESNCQPKKNGKPSVINVPIITNVKAIAANDEIVIYKDMPVVTKEKKSVPAVLEGKPAKKAKVE